MIKRFALLFLFFDSLALSAAEPVNEMCPVTPDEPAESWITTEYEGKVIGFCCKSCLRKFNANPEAYLANLNIQDTSHSESAAAVSNDAVHMEGQDTGHTHGEDVPVENVASSHAEEDGGGHDHATDHVSSYRNTGGRWLALLGNFHVLIVHLPIALLPLAGLLEAMSLFFKSEKWRFAARLNFVAGASMAIVASVLGWIAANRSSYSGELAEVLTWHRWLGVSVASIAATGLLALLLAKSKSPRLLIVYRSVVFILIILVPVVAHLGGTLIYGKNYPF